MTNIRRILLVVIFLTGAVNAVPADSDNTRLIRENRELREKLLQAEKELAEYRMYFANLSVDHLKKNNSEREQRAFYLLDELIKRGNALSISALAVGGECRKLLNDFPLGPARKAQIELRIEELERSAGLFAGLSLPDNSSVGSCRILAVERNLKVIVLSAGAGAGIFPGMVFTAKKDPLLKFKVIGTRVEGAVAEIISGDINNIVPGIEVSALQQRKQIRESILEL